MKTYWSWFSVGCLVFAVIVDIVTVLADDSVGRQNAVILLGLAIYGELKAQKP